jgi:glycerol-3-phosphate acyltransferase PlsY
MEALTRLLAVGAAYLLGSIPTALVYSRLRGGGDIRAQGDGNMGARNTGRVYGFKAGLLVGLMDVFKGVAAVLIARALCGEEVLVFHSVIAQDAPPPESAVVILGATAAILGHDFPVFARFRGGQGLAVTAGVFLALYPVPALIGFAIYGFFSLAFRLMDAGAALGMGQLALTVWLKYRNLYEVLFIVGVLLFIPLKQWIDRSRREEIEKTGSFPA